MYFITKEMSATEIAEATVVFLIKAMKVLPSGAIEPRKACGRITSRAAGRKERPIARAASAWPTGTVFTPERIDSHTNDAVETESARDASPKKVRTSYSENGTRRRGHSARPV